MVSQCNAEVDGRKPYCPDSFVDEKDVYLGQNLVDRLLGSKFFGEQGAKSYEACSDDGQFDFCGVIYRVSNMKHDDHRWGDGGERQYVHILSKDRRPILASVSFVSWSTTFDDSMDYSSRKVDRTYLIEEDELAREIFEGVKKKEEEPSLCR